MNTADWPFAPRRLPFFYGWWIVVVATLGVLASIPGQTVGVSVFTDSLLNATGLSRLEVSTAYLIGTLASGTLLPLGGSLADRIGARAAGVLASLGLGGTLVLLSNVDRVAHAIGDSTTIALVVLSGSFLCLRFCGQGMLTLVSRTMLGRWFERRRGLAAGVAGVVISFGFGGAPKLFDVWIDGRGWRGAWTDMALVVGVGMAVVALLFFRNDPERCGLRMDGAPPRERAPDRTDEHVEEDDDDTLTGLTRGEALRTLAFWAVTFALATQALVVTAVTFHIVDIGASVGGLARGDAVAIFLPVAVASTATGLGGGVLADRVPTKPLLIIMMVGQALAILCVAHLDVAFWGAVVGLGISGGLMQPIATVAYPRLFGRKHLGAIAGAEMMVLVIASALGPMLLASSRDAFGSYVPALYACLALPAIAILLSLRMREQFASTITDAK